MGGQGEAEAQERESSAELLRRLAEQSRNGSTTATLALLKELPAQATEDIQVRAREIVTAALARPAS